MSLHFGSLFSGIGGLDLGLERAGMTCAWQVEIDDYATRVLTKRWPDVPKFRDVRECGAHNLASVDLVCGGFPCQDVSLAGRRAGLDGQRSTLWSEFARIIRELRPRWVLAENVPGLLSSDSGRFFGTVLRDLAQSGYDAEWDCIPAAAVGAPHRRDRVWIAANASCEQVDVAYTTSIRRDWNSAECGSMGQIEGRSVLSRQEWRCSEESTGGSWWATEPNVGRVANGVPARVDRLRCLGNAVVPQVAEWIGQRIMANLEAA